MASYPRPTPPCSLYATALVGQEVLMDCCWECVLWMAAGWGGVAAVTVAMTIVVVPLTMDSSALMKV